MNQFIIFHTDKYSTIHSLIQLMLCEHLENKDTNTAFFISVFTNSLNGIDSNLSGREYLSEQFIKI